LFIGLTKTLEPANIRTTVYHRIMYGMLINLHRLTIAVVSRPATWTTTDVCAACWQARSAIEARRGRTSIQWFCNTTHVIYLTII